MFATKCFIWYIPFISLCLVIREEPKNRFSSWSNLFGLKAMDKPKNITKKHKLMERKAEKCGYKSEKHRIVTSDGYYMNLFKIFKAPPFEMFVKPKLNHVIMFHGLFCSATSWVINKCNRVIPYILVDNGYTVWLPSVRGTRHARRHKIYNYTDDSFWNFSWVDISKYDLDSTIKYVYRISGNQKVHYIGHSQGNLIMFVWAGQKENEAEKFVQNFIAFAPLFDFPANFTDVPWWISKFIGSIFGQMMHPTDLQSNWFRVIGFTCKHLSLYLCESSLSAFGYDKMDLSMDIIRTIVNNNHQDKTSYKNLAHYMQMIEMKQTRYFDYGHGNQNFYGQDESPVVNVSGFNIPTYLFFGQNDTFATISNIGNLLERFSSIVSTRIYNNRGHSFYLYGDFENSSFIDDILDALEDRKIGIIH